MKSKFLIAAVSFLLVVWTTATAQENGQELTFSLKEAQDYALVHNKMVLAAKSDVLATKAALWETISAALPQVEASGSFTDNLKLMTTLLPGEFLLVCHVL